MAWTYTDNPAGVPRDLVRSLIGDVVETPESPSDAVVAYWLGMYPADTYQAAAGVARHMARQFSAMESASGPLKIGGMSLPSTDWAAKSARYLNLADELAGPGNMTAGGMLPGYVPGTVGQFSIGMMDN